MKYRFADLEDVADYVAERIDGLGAYADDFDCVGIALEIGECEDTGMGECWRVNVDDRDFMLVAMNYYVGD